MEHKVLSREFRVRSSDTTAVKIDSTPWPVTGRNAYHREALTANRRTGGKAPFPSVKVSRNIPAPESSHPRCRGQRPMQREAWSGIICHFSPEPTLLGEIDGRRRNRLSVCASPRLSAHPTSAFACNGRWSRTFFHRVFVLVVRSIATMLRGDMKSGGFAWLRPLCLTVLLTFGLSAQAQTGPQLDANDPLGFFTNLASRVAAIRTESELGANSDLPDQSIHARRSPTAASHRQYLRRHDEPLQHRLSVPAERVPPAFHERRRQHFYLRLCGRTRSGLSHQSLARFEYPGRPRRAPS